jgi:predicted RNA-binding protein with PIN domain
LKTLLVDGYNLIHAHPRLAAVAERDWEAAREGLLKELCPLAWPSYFHLVVVVFDAAASQQAEAVVEEREGLEVVFTRRGQSADSFIEAAVRRMVSRGEVEVATNDRTLAGIVVGFGARTIGVDALLEAARRALSETREVMRGISGPRRSPLEDRVSDEVRRMLDEMRYQ